MVQMRFNLTNFEHLNFVTLPLTTGKNDNLRVPFRSGLNWGQRPGRNQNQAYISIPSDIQKSKFFPEIGIPFKVTCDDGFEMLCVRAQQNGKALHSCNDNSIIGLYFRQRLGLASGRPVMLHHLYEYGRLSIDVYKYSNGSFALDFSSKNS
ncbi:MAG: hypothetical protein ACON4W_07055 [Parvibaculales bacterium]